MVQITYMIYVCDGRIFFSLEIEGAARGQCTVCGRKKVSTALESKTKHTVYYLSRFIKLYIHPAQV